MMFKRYFLPLIFLGALMYLFYLMLNNIVAGVEYLSGPVSKIMPHGGGGL